MIMMIMNHAELDRDIEQSSRVRARARGRVVTRKSRASVTLSVYSELAA